MIRAENRRRERIKYIVAELKVRDPFDRGTKLLDPQPGVEGEFSQRDHYTQIRKRIHFSFEIRAAVQQFLRQRLIIGRSAMSRSRDPGIPEQQTV